jgi:glutamate dehydrogenase
MPISGAPVYDLHGQEEFAAALFSGTAPEDVARYEPQELTAFAADAWTFLASRQTGAVKIRITNPSTLDGERANTISIIEIVNDNMPFLVESVLAELAERGIKVLLVADPVINVTRDDGGQLIALSAHALRQVRESFIHLHVERLEDEAQRNEIGAAIVEVLSEARSNVRDPDKRFAGNNLARAKRQLKASLKKLVRLNWAMGRRRRLTDLFATFF